MKLRDRNLITLFKALDGVSLTHEEIKSLEWIAGYEPSTVTSIASVITKAINTRGINTLPTQRKTVTGHDKCHA